MLGFVIGDIDMVTGFKLVGVEGTEATSVEEAQQAFEKALARSDIAVIIISQAFFVQPPLAQAIDRVRRERRTPLIVEVSGSAGPPGEARLSDTVSRITGFRF